MEKKISNRKEAYEAICNDYLQEFCKKQDFEFYYWISIGEIAVIRGYFLNFSDIKLDIDTNQPAGQFFKWLKAKDKRNQKINYYSYTLGLRHKDIKSQKKIK